MHAELRMRAVEEIELTQSGDRWISVVSLKNIEDDQQGIELQVATQRLPVQPEGTIEVNVPLELNKLSPQEARSAQRDPNETPSVRLFVS